MRNFVSRYLHIGTNPLLADALPDGLSRLNNLLEISASHCALYSSIPAALSTLSSLSYLDLSHNALNGSFPGSITALTALGYALVLVVLRCRRSC